jgi:hypothetical protein|tara:strand:+ start:39 stop:686 length:648 start_codon:yes stop_codon:yes gene_type:complete
MTSELKVDKISPASGTSFTLGDSGDTFTVPSGCTITNSGTASGFSPTGITSNMTSGTGMTLNSDGSINKPLQPCFMATIDNGGGNNCTGDGTSVTLGSSDATVTERFDQGGDFTTGTFTAPVTGRYMIGGVLTLINVSSMNEMRVDLECSNRTIYQRVNPGNYKTSGGPDGIGYPFLSLLDVDASDTIKLKFYINGGSKTADMQDGGELFIYLVA